MVDTAGQADIEAPGAAWGRIVEYIAQTRRVCAENIRHAVQPDKVSSACLFDSMEQAMIYTDAVQHYIILGNGTLCPVSEGTWSVWAENNAARLKVRETHLVKRGTSDVWGKVLTYFTGIDACPGSDEPLLWEVKLFGACPFETWRYSSRETAEQRHDGYVYVIISMLRKDGVELQAVEIPQKELS